LSLLSKINEHHIWLNPLLVFITTLSSAFLTYQFPKKFATNHPARYELFKPIIAHITEIFVFSVLLIVLVSIIEFFNKKTIKKLEEENQKYEALSETISENIRELFNGFLYRFATSKANFTTSERVTLYIHNGNNTFIPFGRYSLNTKFAKSGRDSYPDNEGCISKGWEDKWHFDNSFSNPETHKHDYLQEQKQRYGIQIPVMKKLKMKSTLFAALRLDIKDDAIAVIVVESTTMSKYTEKQIKKILEEQEVYLSEMITSLEKYIPKPSNAITVEEL